MRTAQAAASPIAKCNAGAGLLAQVMVAKYADHTPLARQERIFARHGLRLSRQTLCDWVLASAHKLEPLAAALYDFTLTRSGEHPRRVLQGWRGTLQADDFSGYHQGFREGITHAACWAHARRKFYEIDKTAPQGAPPGSLSAHAQLRARWRARG